MFSQIASQSPDHSFTLLPMAFITSDSPSFKWDVGSRASFLGLYKNKSLNPFSTRGSSVQNFPTSVIWTTLLTCSKPDGVVMGFVTKIISVALNDVFGTPISFTTLSKTP